MPIGKMFGSLSPQQQNQIYQPSPAPGQFGGNNYAPAFGRGFQKFQSLMGGQSGLPLPPGLSRLMNGFGGNPGVGMPGVQGMPGGNPAWGAPGSAGAQGYAAPGYPPQGFSQQQPQLAMPPVQNFPAAPGYQPQGYPAQNYPSQGYPAQNHPSQGYPAQNHPSQGYPSQGFLSQGYPQGYTQGPGGQQPAWEAPKKGGIKGFISNLMGKKKK